MSGGSASVEVLSLQEMLDGALESNDSDLSSYEESEEQVGDYVDENGNKTLKFFQYYFNQVLLTEKSFVR